MTSVLMMDAKVVLYPNAIGHRKNSLNCRVQASKYVVEFVDLT